MSKPLSLSDPRLAVLHNTHALLYKFPSGKVVITSIPNYIKWVRPVKVIKVGRPGLTISEGIAEYVNKSKNLE